MRVWFFFITFGELTWFCLF